MATSSLIDATTGMKMGFVILTLVLIGVSGAFYGLDVNDKYTQTGEYTTKGRALVWSSWSLLSVWLLWVMVLVARSRRS